VSAVELHPAPPLAICAAQGLTWPGCGSGCGSGCCAGMAELDVCAGTPWGRCPHTPGLPHRSEWWGRPTCRLVDRTCVHPRRAVPGLRHRWCGEPEGARRVHTHGSAGRAAGLPQRSGAKTAPADLPALTRGRADVAELVEAVRKRLGVRQKLHLHRPGPYVAGVHGPLPSRTAMNVDPQKSK